MKQSKWDVAIIGGGPAGLSAGIALARSRRSVIVIDSGDPRNAPAEGIHNFLTRDGMTAREMAAAGRVELESFGGQFRIGTAETIERSGTGFTIDGTIQARKLLISTGLHDELPAVPGLAERWGRDVLHCPYCHGWEVQDERIGVLATGPMSVHQALMFRQWSDQVLLFLHTGPEPTAEQWEQLAARNVTVIDGEVTEVVAEHDRMTGLRLKDGRRIPVDALVVAPVFQARSSVLDSLGVGIESGAMGVTGIPGLFLAGNVTNVFDGVISSAAAGFAAAVAINSELIAEDITRSVVHRRAAEGPFSGVNEADVHSRNHADRKYGLLL